jgi:hypothetical protein
MEKGLVYREVVERMYEKRRIIQARKKRLANAIIKIVFVVFPAKYTASRRKNKNWLARNYDNVSDWDDMSIRELLFQ